MIFRDYWLVQEHTNERDSYLLRGQTHLDIAIRAVAKRDDKSPYAIANEYIAVELGQLIGLPVVNGIQLAIPNEDGSAETYWASLSVGEDLPPGDPAKALSGSPEFAYGSIVFDIWICNGDRHDKNFAFREESNELLLFDHGEAICGKTGPRFITDLSNDLGLRGTHAIANIVGDLGPVEPWVERIQSLSDEIIYFTVKAAVDAGLPAVEVDPLTSALVNRKRNLMYMLASVKCGSADFPRLNQIQTQIPKLAFQPKAVKSIQYDDHDHTNYTI